VVRLVIEFLQSKDTVSFWEGAFFGYEDMEADAGCHSRWPVEGYGARFPRYRQARERLGAPSLYYAARLGLPEVVKILIELDNKSESLPHSNAGAPRKGKYGDELRVACLFGHEDVIHLLLQAGADAEAEGGRFRTALGASMQAEVPNLKIIELLLDKVRAFSKPDFTTAWILRWAAMEGHMAVVKALLNKTAGLKTTDFYWTKLAHWDSEYLTRISRNAKTRSDAIDRRSYERCHTAPYEAACAGHDEILELLIDKWNNPDERDNEGRTALYWAAFHGHEKVVRILLENGARSDITVSQYGWTAKEWADCNGHRSIVALLGAPVQSEEINALLHPHDESDESNSSSDGDNDEIRNGASRL
jgi:ankyrin repeat protein